MVKIKQQLVSASVVSQRSYGVGNPVNSITIHQTGNTNKGANAEMHARLQSNLNPRLASWQYTVDDVQAIQSFGDGIKCWAAGDGRGPGNTTSIHIEICINSDGDYVKAVKNAAELVKIKLKEHNLGIKDVKQHHDWFPKPCPAQLRAGYMGITWNDFLNMVKNNSSVEQVSNPVSNSENPYDLRYGDTGALVRTLQADLNKLGYKLTVDGSFGPAVENAVKAFQRTYKLAVDGIHGPGSQAKLAEVLKPKPVPKPASKPIPTPIKGDVYRVIVDGKQTGAFGDPSNVASAVRQAVEKKSKKIEIQKV